MVIDIAVKQKQIPSNPSLQSFTFAPGLDLRVIDRDGEPWFIAKDVCDVLGIHTRDVRKILDRDEIADIWEDSIHLTTGQGRLVRNVINQSGLYALILKSRKPEAKAFKKWVTSEVLPSIRRHGGYLAPAGQLNNYLFNNKMS